MKCRFNNVFTSSQIVPSGIQRLAVPLAASLCALLLLAPQGSAATFSFSTGNPDGLMATAARPGPTNGVDVGIFPLTNQTTMGEGPVTGQEIRVDVTLTSPFDLPTNHYFFVPQVLLTDAADHFLWLSAAKPIVSPGTPFVGDLQEWIRNAELDPDWLRVATDIVGTNPTFNATFALTGDIPVHDLAVISVHPIKNINLQAGKP